MAPYADRLYYEGQPLVPVCLIGASGGGTSCAQALPGEQMPSWATPTPTNTVDGGPGGSGYWIYFRLEHESSYARFFLSPSGFTWVVEERSGIVSEFGNPLDASNIFQVDESLVETDSFPNGIPTNSTPQNEHSQIFENYRWRLTRQFDAHGAGVNRVEYQWATAPFDMGTHHKGELYLQDVFYTPLMSAVAAQTEPWGQQFSPSVYAYHVHLTWTQADTNTSGGMPVPTDTPLLWRTLTDQRLTRVDVTSYANGKGAGDGSAQRFQVRSWALGYSADTNAQSPRMLLTSVTKYGECGANTENQTLPSNIPALSNWSSCSSLTTPSCGSSPPSFSQPPMTMAYTPSALSPIAIGMGTITTSSVPVLADVNGDGLADVVASAMACTQQTMTNGQCPQPALWLNNAGSSWGTQQSIALANSASTLTQTTLSSVFFAGQNAGPPYTQAYLLGNFGGGGTSSLDVQWTDFDDYADTIFSLVPSAGSGARASGWELVPQQAATVNNLPQPVTIPPFGGPAVEGLAGEGLALITNVDIDGDGVVDQLAYDPENITATGLVSLINSPTTFGPQLASAGAPFVYAWDTGNDENAYQGQQSFALADMTGEGAPDLAWIPFVNQGAGQLLVARGWGDGSFDASPYVFSPISAGLMSDFTGLYGALVQPGSLAKWALHDVNGDGYADLIVIAGAAQQIQTSSDGIDIYFSTAHGFPSTPSLTILHGSIPNWTDILNVTSQNWGYPMRFADMNGSGTDDIVLVFPTSSSTDANGVTSYTYAVTYIDVMAGVQNGTTSTPMAGGLLSSISNGRGATTTLTYETIADLEASAATPWTSVTPQALHVVAGVNTAVAGPNSSYSTRYTYANPVYDKRYRRFRGFQQSTETVYGALSQNNQVTQRSFDIGGPQCAGTSTCTITSTDEPQELVEGLPVWKLVTSGSAKGATTVTPLSATHLEYTVHSLYAGLDGRQTRALALTRTDTWFFDGTTPVSVPSCSASPSSCTSFNDINDSTGGDNLARTGLYPVPAGGSSAPLTVETLQTTDVFGNVTHVIDEGEVLYAVSGSSENDSPIDRASAYALAPGQDWTWRAVDVCTAGSATATACPPASPSVGNRHIHNSYNSTGDLVEVMGDLVGTAALQRASGGAPAPAGALADQVNLPLATFAYAIGGFPSVGRVSSASSGDGLRTTTYGYDTYFGDLLARKTESPNIQSGTAPTLITSFVYDRGLAAVTQQVDPNGAQSVASYDPFGRTAATYRPNPTTGAAVTQNSCVVYTDPVGGPYSSAAVTELMDDVPTSRRRTVFTDGLGRQVATVSQSGANDPEPWILSGFVDYDTYGRIVVAYLPSFTPTAPPTAPAEPVGTPSSTYAYDAFGRTVTAADPVGNTTSTAYPPLSRMVTAPKPTASRLDVYDGHGRLGLSKLTSNTLPSSPQYTSMTYQPTGEVTSIQAFGAESYSRWMQYDSLGHLVVNAEPNTSTGYSSNFTVGSSWRYAYDLEGEVVGTSDARGCGENITYDDIGRVVSEDYSPCGNGTYSAPTGGGNGTEVFRVYDVPESGEAAGNYGSNASFLMGRLAATYSRGEHTQYAYDARGRVTVATRALGVPGAATISTLSARYANSTHAMSMAYDELDRLVAQSAGAGASQYRATAETSSLWSLAHGNTSAVVTSYDARNIPTYVSSSYGVLVASGTERHDAAGSLLARTYGDAAHTVLGASYYPDESVENLEMSRGTGPWVSGAGYTPPPTGVTTQAVLQHLAYVYDADVNPTSITDSRNASEWPSGYKPVSRLTPHDDLDRLESVAYTYPSGTDTQASPYVSTDTPPPPWTQPTSRVASQTFTYDALNNLTGGTDDQSALLQRSVGTPTYGTASSGPNQMLSGTNSGSASPSYALTYDAAGNTQSLTYSVAGTRTTTSTIDYTWDEVGHLAGASRTDYISCTVNRGIRTCSSNDSFSETFVYDSDGHRVWRSSNASGTTEYWAEIFPGLRLNDAAWDLGSSGTGDFSDTDATEAVYLVLGGTSYGRVYYESEVPTQLPEVNGNALHVFLQMTDPLGSTASTIDSATGELVEQITYQPYGGTETDYRPSRWQSFRETYRYTGKEDDYAMGLVYFGARYYMPSVSRWASPDPLTIHGASGDLNPYAFVRNSPFRFTDPTGLQEQEPNQSGPSVSVSFDLGQILSNIGSSIANFFGSININGTVPSGTGVGGAGSGVSGPLGSSSAPPLALFGHGTEAQNVAAYTAFTQWYSDQSFNPFRPGTPQQQHDARVNAAVVKTLAPMGEAIAAIGILGPEVLPGLAAGEALAGGAAAAEGVGSAGPRILYHYTSAAESRFAGGLWSGTSVTDTAKLSATEAVEMLGLKSVPDKIIPVINNGNFVPNRPFIVQPHPLGPGGGTEFFNVRLVPPGNILPAIPIGGGG